MKITPVPHGLDIAKSVLPRSPGLHMSSLYSDLYCDLEPKRFERGGTPDPLRLEAGLSLELMLEEGFHARHAERPGELVTEEGIIYSPDLILFEDGYTRLGEIKLTWASAREVPMESATTFPPSFSRWFVQMQAYCHALQTPHARLIAFFVNGNYRPQKPTLHAWDIEFTARELKENYQMLLNHGRSKGML